MEIIKELIIEIIKRMLDKYCAKSELIPYLKKCDHS